MRNKDSIKEMLDSERNDHSNVLKELSNNQLLGKLRCNGCSGITLEDDDYTRYILIEAFKLLANNIIAIIPVSVDKADNPKEVEDLLNIAKKKGWHIIGDPLEEWYTIIVLDSKAIDMLPDEDTTATMIKMIMVADQEYWG